MQVSHQFAGKYYLSKYEDNRASEQHTPERVMIGIAELGLEHTDSCSIEDATRQNSSRQTQQNELARVV